MENFEEMFLGKKAKKGGIKDKIKKLGDKIKEGTKGAAMLPALAPLAAFSPVMKKAIKKKGETPKKGLKNLAEQFYNLVVKGKSSKENIVEDIASIVAAILKWIQERKDKQAQGTATPEELEFLNEGEKALKNFNPDTWQDDDVTTKSTSSGSDEAAEGDNKMMYIILAIIIIAVVAKQ